LQINHYNFTTLQIASTHLQVQKFPTLAKLQNYNLTNCKCAFANSCKFANLQNLEIANYKFTTLQIATTHLQVCKITTLSNYQI
jgi:hypothetical protein